MFYNYVAKSSDGQQTSGSLEAASRAEAMAKLRQQRLFALSITEEGAADQRGKSGGGRRKRVTKTDLLMLTSQMAIMCRSGVDLAEALRGVAEQCQQLTLRPVLETVYRDVTEGRTASDALRKHVHIFGEAYIAMIAAGEASGKVPEVLARLAELLRNEIRLRSTISSVLAYPLVLMSVSALVVVAVVFFVLPQFGKVFAELEAPVPKLTQFLLTGSALVRDQALWLIGGLVGGVVMLKRGWSTGPVRLYRDRFMIDFRLLRSVTRSLLTGRLFRLLGTLLQSGVPVLDALRLCRASIANTRFRQLVDDLERSVMQGAGMAPMLYQTEFLPPGAAQMAATAERSGSLGSVLQSVGEFYEDDAERRLREAAKLIEPAIIVFMGLLVAMLVLAIILPLLDFSTMSG